MRKQMAKILTAVLLLGTLTDVSTAKAVAPKLNKSKLTLYIGSNYTLKVKKASGAVTDFDVLNGLPVKNPLQPFLPKEK